MGEKVEFICKPSRTEVEIKQQLPMTNYLLLTFNQDRDRQEMLR